MKHELKLAYEAACANYIAAFMEQYGLTCDPEPWVANEIGGIVNIGDCFFGFDEIRLCVDNDVPWNDLIEWYDYNTQSNQYGLATPNLKSWLKGCPRVSKERLDEICEHWKALDELIEQTKKEAKQ